MTRAKPFAYVCSDCLFTTTFSTLQTGRITCGCGRDMKLVKISRYKMGMADLTQ